MADFLAMAPLWYVAFLFSTVCHEAAHALVAKWGGDRTAYAGGQVTLDPIPHVKREPFGLIVIPLITLLASKGGSMFGWGSAPFDPFWQIRYPRRAAVMALAGPATNFLIAFVAAVLMQLLIKAGIFELARVGLVAAPAGGLWDGLAVFLRILFILNVILGVFNLLPVPPLDGYSALGLILPESMFLKLLEFSRSSGFGFFGIFIAYELSKVVVGPVVDRAVYLFLITL
jgi:Zn-dependent protease